MPARCSVIPGSRFGRFTVLRELPVRRFPSGKTKRMVECKCDCGATCSVQLGNLRSGSSISCGCYAADLARKAKYKIGGRSTPGYNSWIHMRKRCLDPESCRYAWYGARGITVCARWLGPRGFENFISDVGPRPSSKHSIDRYPNKNGNYEPGNVRWATHTQQMRNTRRSVEVTCDGVTRTVPEWAEITGIPANRIRSRLAMGWPALRAIGRERAA